MSTSNDASLAKAPARRRRDIDFGFDRFSGIYAFVLIVIVFTILEGSTFLSIDVAHSIAGEKAVVALLALGIIVPLAAGMFDLSVAAIANLAAVLTYWLQVEHGLSPIEASLIAFAAGVLVGAINGFVVVRLRVNSFIATLAMATISVAVVQLITGGRQITGIVPATFQELFTTQIFGFQAIFYYVLVLALVLWYVMEQTPLGRYMFAAGGNPDAARLAGVRVDGLVFGSFVVSGAIGAFAGIAFFGRIGAAPLEFGPALLLPAFAAAYLGATQIRVGRVNAWGTLIAIYVLATGVRGIQLVSEGSSTWIEPLFYGVALIGAVALAERARAQGLSRRATGNPENEGND